MKWRVSDVAPYYLATNGDEEAAAGRLAEIVKDGLKGVIAKRTIQQVVAAERAEFIGDILQFAGQSVGQLGLTLVDVRVKRIDLPEEVSESVYNRMRQNFARQASQLRAEGDEQAQRIRAEAERERTELLAIGNRDAEVIRGEGRCASGRHLRACLPALPRVLFAAPQPPGLPQFTSASRTTSWSLRPRASSSST